MNNLCYKIYMIKEMQEPLLKITLNRIVEAQIVTKLNLLIIQKLLLMIII